MLVERAECYPTLRAGTQSVFGLSFPGNRERARNLGRSIELLAAVDETQSMQPLVILPPVLVLSYETNNPFKGAFLSCLGHNVERAGLWIDNRCAGNPDLVLDVPSIARLRRRDRRDFPRQLHITLVDELALPVDVAGTAIGINGINAIVLGGDEHDVVRSPGDRKVCNIQGLRVYRPIDCAGEEFAKCRRSDRGRSQGIFEAILPGALSVVAPGKDALKIGDGNCRLRAFQITGAAAGGLRCGSRRLAAENKSHCW